MVAKAKTSIDTLIEIVKNGGSVKTGVDVFSHNDVLLLDKDVSISNVKILLTIKEKGILEVPISPGNGGGFWDKSGRQAINVRSVCLTGRS